MLKLDGVNLSMTILLVEYVHKHETDLVVSQAPAKQTGKGYLYLVPVEHAVSVQVDLGERLADLRRQLLGRDVGKLRRQEARRLICKCRGLRCRALKLVELTIQPALKRAQLLHLRASHEQARVSV